MRSSTGIITIIKPKFSVPTGLTETTTLHVVLTERIVGGACRPRAMPGASVSQPSKGSAGAFNNFSCRKIRKRRRDKSLPSIGPVPPIDYADDGFRIIAQWRIRGNNRLARAAVGFLVDDRDDWPTLGRPSPRPSQCSK